MKKMRTWMISAVLVFCLFGLTACGDNNKTAGTAENNADKTNSSYYVNGATDTRNRYGDDGIADDALDDIGDAGKGVIDGVGDAGKAVIDGAEDLGDTLTGNRDEDDYYDDDRANTVNP